MTRFVVASALVALGASSTSHAFCGFYVSSAGANLFNDATTVVLLRDGTRTVLSMQNNYRGPTEDFALVIPVPVILGKENVKTLPKSVFERVDALSGPRLVEYNEPGDCGPPPPMAAPRMLSERSESSNKKSLGVQIEAKFEVGEYEILILSAKEALGLETWLKEYKYKIPENAAPLLAPYVKNNWKFFVAKVNAKKVNFVAGQAVLSPLRFHYDAEKFELPIRLGLANSAGTQDLLVHVIGKQRYELANRPNVLVPTNIEVTPAVEPEFGAFYAALVEKTFAKNREAAITEFAWKGALPPPRTMVSSGIYGVTCDPCPPPHPVDDPLARLLGVDVLPGIKTDEDVAKFAKEATLTRLHLRYGAETAKDDLVFRITDPIAGGIPDKPRPTAARENRFQGRFIMWKPFDPSKCWRGVSGAMGWSAPPPTPTNMTKPGTLSSAIERYLRSDIPEVGLTAAPPAPTKK